MKGKIFQVVSAKCQYRLHWVVKARNLKNRFLNWWRMSFHWRTQQKEKNKMVKPDNIPSYLKEHGSWCNWKFEERKKDLTKDPYNPNPEIMLPSIGQLISYRIRWFFLLLDYQSYTYQCTCTCGTLYHESSGGLSSAWVFGCETHSPGGYQGASSVVTIIENLPSRSKLAWRKIILVCFLFTVVIDIW